MDLTLLPPATEQHESLLGVCVSMCVLLIQFTTMLVTHSIIAKTASTL